MCQQLTYLIRLFTLLVSTCKYCLVLNTQLKRLLIYSACKTLCKITLFSSFKNVLSPFYRHRFYDAVAPRRWPIQTKSSIESAASSPFNFNPSSPFNIGYDVTNFIDDVIDAYSCRKIKHSPLAIYQGAAQ